MQEGSSGTWCWGNDSCACSYWTKQKKNQELPAQKKLGRPKNILDISISELVRTFIMSANASSSPLSMHILWQELKKSGHKFSSGSYYIYSIP